jgi:GTPase SAR1 family protein
MQAIIYAYDVTRRETFESIQNTWMEEVKQHCNVDGAIKMIVANKVDRDSEREVARQEGAAFARAQGCLFVETSAKANTAVTQVTFSKAATCSCKMCAHQSAARVALCHDQKAKQTLHSKQPSNNTRSACRPLKSLCARFWTRLLCWARRWQTGRRRRR